MGAVRHGAAWHGGSEAWSQRGVGAARYWGTPPCTVTTLLPIECIEIRSEKMFTVASMCVRNPKQVTSGTN